MSRYVLGNCVEVMSGFPDKVVDLILTDPPYLVGFRDRSGRTLAGDKTDEWLQPACTEMYRVLKKDALMISFYGWNRVDRFMAAWKNAGFSVVGHLVFAKTYTSKSAYVGYSHECAYILAKGRPPLPETPLRDVLDWKYTGNKHHPTEKPVSSLQPLIESFTRPGGIVLDPFAGSGSTCVAALQAGRRYSCSNSITAQAFSGWLPFSARCICLLPTVTGFPRPHDELRRKRSAAGRRCCPGKQHVRPARHA